jgi:hypothetical protein
MNDKISYLGFIQSIILRMNTNSFFIKGWAATLISALLAFSFNKDGNNASVVAYLPLFLFWYLDSTYLTIERKYIKLYEIASEIYPQGHLSLKTSSIKVNKTAWLSRTILPYYVTLFSVITFFTRHLVFVYFDCLFHFAIHIFHLFIA